MRVVRIFLCLLLAVPPAAAEDWTMYRFDETHQGFSASNTQFGVFKSSAETPNGKWWSQALGVGVQIESSPVIAGGKLFIGASNGFLYALDAVSGSPLWNFSAGSRITGVPAVSGGSVFFATDVGTLYKLNAETGQKDPNQYTVGATTSSPAIHQDKIFIGNNAGEIHSVDANTMQLYWKFSVQAQYSATNSSNVASDPPAPITGTPAIFSGRVFFGAWNNKFYSINEFPTTRNNQIVTVTHWTFATTAPILASAAIDATNRRVIFGTNDGIIFSLSTESGTASWQKDDKDDLGNPTQIESSPAVAYGRVFYGANNGRLIARGLTDGSLSWNFTTGGPVKSAPAVANHYIIVGSQDRKVYLVSEADGKEKWQFTAADAFKSSPALSGSQAFIASTDGNIYSFGQDRPPRPDLRIVNMTADGAVSGATVSVVVEVANVGSSESTATTVKLFAGTTLIGEQPLGKIAASMKTAVSFAWTPAGAAPVLLKSIADANNIIKEFDEGNNVREMTVTVGEPAPPPPEETSNKDEEGAPGFELFAVLAGVGLLVFLRRRNRA